MVLCSVHAKVSLTTLTLKGGPQAMLQGAATYAGFTYFLDKFFASPSSQHRQETEQLMYNDIPLDE